MQRTIDPAVDETAHPGARGRLAAGRAAAVALLALHALLAWVGRAPGILTGQDDSRYLILARALRHGAYRDVMWPGAPYHHMYPPGYPLLLALWGAIGGDRFDWLVLLQVGLSAAALALVFDVARRTMGATVALCALAVMAVNPELVAWAGQIASEDALAFCFALALWGATVLPRGRRQGAVVLGAALAAPLVRTAGVVLPAAVVAAWLLERRYRDALVAAVASAAVVGPLLLWTLTDPSLVPGSSYAADLVVAPGGRVVAAASTSMWHVLAHRVAVNAVYYPTQAVPWLLALPTIPGTRVDNVIDVALLAAALAVGAARDFRALRIGVLSVLGTAALLLVWPYQIARYATPVLPLIVLLFIDGVARIGAAFGGRARATTAVAVALMMIAAGAARTGARVSAAAVCAHGRPLPDERCLTPEQVSFFRAVRFVGDSLPADARILSAKSGTLYIYTGRPVAPLAPLARLDSGTFWRALPAMGIDYVLLGALHEDERPRLASRLAERCGELTLVRAFPPYAYLFRIAPGASGVVRPATASPSPTSSDSASCAALHRYERETVPIVGVRDRASPPPGLAGGDRRSGQSAAETSTRLS